jgi:hypothetical protein
MLINKYRHDMGHLFGKSSSRPIKDSKYRILCYDRKNDVYCFIRKNERKTCYDVTLFETKTYVARYKCYKVYVFPKYLLLPIFNIAILEDVRNWAESNCLKSYQLFDRWKSEAHDEDYMLMHNNADHIDRQGNLSPKNHHYQNKFLLERFRQKYNDEYEYCI